MRYYEAAAKLRQAMSETRGLIELSKDTNDVALKERLRQQMLMSLKRFSDDDEAIDAMYDEDQHHATDDSCPCR